MKILIAVIACVIAGTVVAAIDDAVGVEMAKNFGTWQSLAHDVARAMQFLVIYFALKYARLVK